MPGLGRRPVVIGVSREDADHAQKDGDVGDVEDARVKWTEAENAEIGDKPMPRQPIDVVAESACGEEGKAEARTAVKGESGADKDNEHGDDEDRSGHGEDEQTGGRSEAMTQTEKAAGVLGQGELYDPVEEFVAGARREASTRDVLRRLIAGDSGKSDRRKK